MERGHDHSNFTESDIENSSVEICSEEISSEEISEHEKTLEDEIRKKDRFEKRKTTWDDLFQHFENLDEDPNLATDWNIRDENEAEQYGQHPNDIDNGTRLENGKDSSGNESDNEYLFNNTNENESSEQITDNVNNDTSSYYAEDESSRVLNATEFDNLELESSLKDKSKEIVFEQTYFNDPQNEKHLNGDNKRIEKGSCTACGKLTYLPVTYDSKQQMGKDLNTHYMPLTSEDRQWLQTPMCVKCLSKESGHDECIKKDCTTCHEFARINDNIENCRKRVLNFQRKKGMKSNSNVMFETRKEPFFSNTQPTSISIGRRFPEDMGRDTDKNVNEALPFLSDSDANTFSFEENRYRYCRYRSKVYQSPSAYCSYRPPIEKGYETDSSYSQSSVSSSSTGSSNCNSQLILKKPYKWFCVICKTNMLPLSSSYDCMENIIPICDTCTQGHLYCEKKECKTCYNIAKVCSRVSSDISFKQRNRKLRNKTGGKSSKQAIQPITPQNPDNSSFIQHFQEQDIGSMQNSTFQIISPHKKYQLQNISRNRSPPPANPDLEKSREILGLAIEKKLKAHYNLPTFKPKKRFLMKTPRKDNA